MVKDRRRLRIWENLRRHHVTLLKGAASFLDPHTVAVRPERCPEVRLTGDVVLVATGSYPFRPKVFPFHDPRVYDSDSILTLQAIPPTMLVVGGGVIGCEYACIFAALGVKVTVVEKRGLIIGSMDREVSESLQNQMEDTGVAFIMNDEVASVTSGEHCVDIRLKSGEMIAVHAVLVSSGRCGQTDGLGLDLVGIETNDRGQMAVNGHYQTSVPHIYAAGDVIGGPSLASTSMEQARLAMIHAFNLRYRTDLAAILPYGIYTIPECSMAGQTEEQLTADKVPYVAGTATYAANARGQIIGDRKGFLKLLFKEDDMKLLGVHVIGEQATELVHVGLTALLLNAGADLFINTCYNYPTLTEVASKCRRRLCGAGSAGGAAETEGDGDNVGHGHAAWSAATTAARRAGSASRVSRRATIAVAAVTPFVALFAELNLPDVAN